MNPPLATVEQIESSVTYRDDDMIESSVFVPVLGADVTLVVYLNHASIVVR